MPLFVRIWAAVAIALSWTMPTFAQSATGAGRELTPADVEAWLDGLMDYAMVRGSIAGGVVVAVKDGGVLLQKGYGYADVAQAIPVDPRRTLFRVGSISKLFTWTAVMQLVDQGKIDLDRDINRYLDFQIPAAFDRPVTMRHLMTHTAGFGEQIKGTVAAAPGQFRSLEQYVKSSLPKRISPPGEVPAYSNYGAALAGYIVQRVSGEEFDDYLDRHVLQPLGMRHATSHQPVPIWLTPDLSQGYRVASAKPLYFELIPSPMGGVSASGADMARFMIAHLQAASGNGRLLSPGAARLMHSPASRPVPAVTGVTLGFAVDREARPVIGHGGDTQVFHSTLKLFLADQAGLFVSFNSTGNRRAAAGLLKGISEGFAERYFPTPAPVVSQSRSALPHGRQLAAAGPYERSRGRADSVLGRLSGLFGQQQIIAHGDGTITLTGALGLNGEPKRWTEIQPHVWQEIGGTQRLAADIVDGRVRAVGMDSMAGTGLLLPVPATRSSSWIFPLMLVATAILMLTAICWPIAVLVRRYYGWTHISPPREVIARRLAYCAAIVNLAMLFGWALFLQKGMSDASVYGGQFDPWLRFLQLLALFGAFGAATAAWSAWLTWRGARGRWTKLCGIVLGAACLIVVWFAFTFGLVTISLDY